MVRPVASIMAAVAVASAVAAWVAYIGLLPSDLESPKDQASTDLESAKDLTTSRKRVSELERKVGQQQIELDFFRQALRQVGGARQPSEGPGARASTRSSRR